MSADLVVLFGGARRHSCGGLELQHHNVVSTTNHHNMFDIVTAYEDDASFSVNRQGFDYCYPRWCVAAAEPVEHVIFSPQRMPVREAIWRCLANVPISTVFPPGGECCR
jgi:hypothetical protein